ncbi:MAG: hypothetical protein JO097_19430 [Acidobacteriaceae bacterium]|nr:hypothetical protein [Acidobacteriaceae bacterium]MBV9294102.1 hypothetical protein [Acidobacteriaceae bacterium]MBV9764473.1 hypothetical protein [Acidobacteriaceae bacterium]
MLTQANHWLDIAGTVIDGLLLCRVLLLKLHRVYLFITLVCLLGLFFDIVLLWLGPSSQESARVFLYSRFLYAVLFPAVAWEVFEEMKLQISKLRRLGILRLISGLLLATIFGLIVSAFAENEPGAPPARLATLAVVLWAGSSTACLTFLFALQKNLRAQEIMLPRNTFVWLIFYQLSFTYEILSCFFLVVAPLLKSPAIDTVQLFLSIYDIAITSWCILKLRSLPSDVPSAPEKASL